MCGHTVFFEDQADPANKSFFSEIISSVSDVKFSHDGVYFFARDYLSIKVCTRTQIALLKHTSVVLWLSGEEQKEMEGERARGGGGGGGGVKAAICCTLVCPPLVSGY